MTDTFGPAKSCKPILQLWHPRELANEQLIQVMVKIWERGLWKKTTNKMHRKHKILMLSLVGLGLIYVFGLAFPIYNFFSTVFWRLQYFKLGITEQREDAVKFFLWTHPTRLQYSPLQIGNLSSLYAAGFNSSWPIKLLIHGFGDSGITSWTDRVRKAYMMTGSYNVISLDWEEMASQPWYSSAVKNCKVAGRVGAQFLNWLVHQKQTSWDKIHIIGSSLGGHAAGYAGRFCSNSPFRVTGLDPSGPLFHSVTTEDRLDSSDGQFVDVIHTAGRWIGDEDVLGHVDIFVNGGRSPQPGCANKESLDLSCSHFRAWQLFVQSVYAAHSSSAQNPVLLARRCPSYSHLIKGQCCLGNTTSLGDGVSRDARGSYHLRTTTKPYLLPSAEAFHCPKETNLLPQFLLPSKE